ADFQRPGISRELTSLIADLQREADANGPVPTLGDTDPGADMVADPLPAGFGLYAGEKVEAGFEPGGKAVSDFDRLVEGVLGRDYPLFGMGCALGRDVTVQFDHGAPGRGRLRPVHLDFEVLLGCDYGRGRETEPQQEGAHNRVLLARHTGLPKLYF